MGAAFRSEEGNLEPIELEIHRIVPEVFDDGNAVTCLLCSVNFRREPVVNIEDNRVRNNGQLGEEVLIKLSSTGDA